MSSNRTAIAAEIQTALRQWGPMTSAKLAEFVPSAEDREVISKVIYQLKTNGIIEKGAEVPGAPGRGAKTIAVWRLAKPITFATEEEPMPSVHMKFQAKPPLPASDYPPFDFDDHQQQAPSEDYQPATEAPLGGTYAFNHVAETLTGEPGATVKVPLFTAGSQYEAVNASEPADTPAIDPTEEALSDLIDQADEAVLALADSLLSDHPMWSRLRQLQSDTFQALCDYRLRSYLSTQDKDPNQ